MSEDQIPNVRELSTPEQFNAIRSMLRRAMLCVMLCKGACTVKEIAEAVGRSPQALYRHMQLLESAELVRRAGERGEGRERQVVYEVTASAGSWPDRDLTAQERQALLEVATTDLRAAERSYTKVVNDPKQKVTGPDRVVGRMTQVMWLTPDERRALNEALVRILYERRPGRERYSMGREGAEGYAVVMTYFPWDPKDSEEQPEADPEAADGPA